MTHDANRCLCEECSDYRAAQVRRNRRRGLRDLSTFTPAVVTRDAAAGVTTTHKEKRSAGHPTGQAVTQGDASCVGVADGLAAQLPSCSEPSCDRLGQSSASTNREAGVEATTRTPGVDDPELSSWRTPTSGAVTGESVPTPEHVVAAPDPTSGHEPGDPVAASRAVPSPLVRASG